MSLVPAGELVAAAAKAEAGILGFNIIHLESAEAVVEAAERAGRAVIIQISENCVKFHGGLAPLAKAATALAVSADAPIGLHLDHATTSALVDEAIGLGFRSVMIDHADLGYHQNVTATRDVVERCHGRQVWVEAELGEVGGKNGVHSPTARTDPARAESYVRETGADALAVAIGTSHAMTSQEAVIDYQLLAALRTAVNVPLVLHGSSGVSDRDLSRAIRCGITKVNIATRLSSAWTAALRTELASDTNMVDSRRYTAAARTAMAREAERLLRDLGSLPTATLHELS